MSDPEQEKINQYFCTAWLARNRTLDMYRFSGWALLGEVAPHESVLDVGCGDNLFKKHLDVFGIDPANAKADLMVTIEEFSSERLFDVAFCLGSINFGPEERIRRQIEAVRSHLKASNRIYWRCNPGRHDHGNNEFNSIDVFPWTFEYHRQSAAQHGYEIAELKWDTHNRIYAEWRK